MRILATMTAGRARRASLAVLALALVGFACTTTTGPVGPVGGGPTPSPCGLRCAPPARSAAAGHQFRNARFQLTYLDPFQVTKQDDNGVILEYANQNTGNVFDVEFLGTDVKPGTTAQALLGSVAKQLNLGQLAGAQDLGPIYGAEIGYVAGAGDAIAGTEDLPNAPNSPVVIELMTSIKGASGLAFISVSTLNPNTQHPGALIGSLNSELDTFVNSVVW
jgi:hypothetical protein